MKNKPVLNLCLNLVGLLSAGLLMGFHGTYEPLLKSFSETLVFEGAGHNEADWAKRLDKPLLFLLGKKQGGKP